MLVVGVDPGGTTALALLQDDVVLAIDAFVGNSNHPVYGDVDGFLSRAIQRNQAPEPMIVAAEDFIGGGPRNPINIYTLKVLGFVEGWAVSHGASLHIQTPQKRYAFRSLARDQLILAEIPQPSRHMIDATAHALACGHALRTKRG